MMDRSGRSRALTPLIGVGLAVIVTGSLVSLGLLARGVTLEGPLGAPVLPRVTAAEAPDALVIGNPESDARRQTRRPRSPRQEIVTLVERTDTTSDAPVVSEPARTRDDSTRVLRKTITRAARPYFDRDRDGSTATRSDTELREGRDDTKKSKHAPNGRALGHKKARGNGHAKHDHDRD